MINLESVYCQGFYDNNRPFLSKKNISNLNILSVLGTTDYSDSIFHKLSNFVFERNFNKQGDIINQKGWEWQLTNGKYLNIKLVLDSAYLDSSTNITLYKATCESKIVKFNQEKSRSRDYINNIFNQFTLKRLKRIGNRASGKREFIVDTILLGKKISIPSFLIPYGDSTLTSNDTIKVFKKLGAIYYLSEKYYRVEGDKIVSDWTERGDNEVWRSYTINKSGLLEKEVQNIFTTLYFYDSDNLHIKTETYQGETRTRRTSFKYCKDNKN